MCFHDGDVREAPVERKNYLASRHITLRFGSGEQATIDARLNQQGFARKISLTVANFSAVPAFTHSTNLVATLSRLLQLNLMRDFQICTAPVDTGQFTMYLLWH